MKSWLIPLATLALSSTAVAQEPGDRAALLSCLQAIANPGGALPGEVLAFGERAFVLASAGKGDTARGVMAATRAGRGRAVAFGHNAFLSASPDDAERLRLLANTLAWAGEQPAEGLDVLVLGDALPALEPLFDDVDTVRELPASFRSYDAVLWRDGDLAPDAVERLVEYVERGGGLVFGVCPWGRQQLYGDSGRSIRTDLSHNQVAVPLGLVFGFDTAGGASHSTDSARAEALHAGRATDTALEVLTGKLEDAAPETARLTGALVRALPKDHPLGARRLADALADVDLAPLAPSRERPVRLTDVRARLALTLATLAWQEAAPEAVPAAPGHQHFPGEVPARTKPVERSFAFTAIDVARRGWLSTGLYARAGEPLEVAAENAAGWSVRIGAHTDTLWHKDEWRRWPEISSHLRLAPKGEQRLTSPFGGLVYLIPGNGSSADARFTLHGAIEAPLFDATDPASVAAWPRARKRARAPWAELVTDGVVISVPAPSLTHLEDPAELAAYWSAAMACYPELLGEPLHPRERPERLVEDVQISAGWMHSGYPVMAHGADTPEHSAATDLATLRTAGDWGFFHEFGHNAQDPRWTFDGTGEVTCNLFSLYLGERMAGIEPWQNPWLENQKAKLAPHLTAGAPFDAWKRDPGLALLLFALVQRDFGWAPYQEALASYTPDVRMADDLAERDGWLLRLSRATERDLGPYFQAMGVPTSAEARAEVAHFEPWLPPEARTD